MVWCNCPTYCKRGRKVSNSTYRRHNPRRKDISQFGAPLQRFLTTAAGYLAFPAQNDLRSGKRRADNATGEALPSCSKRQREVIDSDVDSSDSGPMPESVKHSFGVTASSPHTCTQGIFSDSVMSPY